MPHCRANHFAAREYMWFLRRLRLSGTGLGFLLHISWCFSRLHFGFALHTSQLAWARVPHTKITLKRQYKASVVWTSIVPMR
eukprot:2856882-Amphidinium_carterae.3